MKEYRLPMRSDIGAAVIREGARRHCPMCNDWHNIISFGLQHNHDGENATQVFFWCICGHKWIEEPGEGEI